MQSKGELKEIDIKNRMGYFFDYIIADRDIYSVNILLSKKLYETYKTILICSISYKTSIGPKPLRISFDKMDGFIRVLKVKLNISYYLIVGCLINFVIRLNIELIIILEKPVFIHKIIYLFKKY